MARDMLECPLSCEEDIKEFRTEGDIRIDFDTGTMRMETGTSAADSRGSSGWLWYPVTFPADIMIEWEFRPLNNKGAAAVSFAVKNGNGFHVFYYNRKNAEDRAFHILRMMKDAGAHEVAIGADPLPDMSEVKSLDIPDEDMNWYHMAIIKKSRIVSFAINGLEVLNYHDDGFTHGEMLTGGNVGLGQLAGLSACYRNLRLTWI